MISHVVKILKMHSATVTHTECTHVHHKPVVRIKGFYICSGCNVGFRGVAVEYTFTLILALFSRFLFAYPAAGFLAIFLKLNFCVSGVGS